MQILQGRNARSDLPMSNAARKQLGIQSKVISNSDKHGVLLTYDVHVGQHVMYQDSISKHWYPAVIECLCPEPRTYKTTTRDGVTYKKKQAHPKPYAPQNKNIESSQCLSQLMAQFDHNKSSQVNNQMQVHTGRPKRDTKPPIKLDL